MTSRLSGGPDAVPVGVATLAVGLALLVWQARFRVAEAWGTAHILRLAHLRPARSLGPNVVFPLQGRWVGFTLTVACTAALLLVPFFAVAGLLLVARRIDSRRAVTSLLAASALIIGVNQLRLLAIAGSMFVWGFQKGYERSHVFIGTLLSTTGVIVGVIVFVWMLIGRAGRRPMGHSL